MHVRHVRRSVSIWMATLVLLLGALAPTLSQAFKPSGTQGWAARCLALTAGARPDGTGPASLPEKQDHALVHCPYCALHVLGLGVPLLGLRLALLDLAFASPQHARDMAMVSLPWQLARPRGPPGLV